MRSISGFSLKTQIIIFASVFVLGTCFVTIMNYKERKRFANLINVMHDDSINGKVKTLNINKGCIVIKLYSNNFEYQLQTLRNEDYSPSFSGYFIHPGDSLVKNAFSDTLHIYRNGTSYYFILL